MTSYLSSPQGYLNGLTQACSHTKILDQSDDSHQVSSASSQIYKAFPEEDVLSLASVLADLRKASSESNPHRATESLHRLIRSVTEGTGSFPTKDYSLSSDTVGISIDDLVVHSMRDAIQWWAHWDRAMVDDYWKHIYIAFPQFQKTSPFHRSIC
ncbi:hypothetical protein N7540_002175 [Penicillium herquei]|nr:hypothetical protein N7540_002175 [Penicillium herquei]